MLVQHHPTLLDATCWPRLNTMLDDVGLSLNLLKTFIQHRATLLAQQCYSMFCSDNFLNFGNGLAPHSYKLSECTIYTGIYIYIYIL